MKLEHRREWTAAARVVRPTPVASIKQAGVKVWSTDGLQPVKVEYRGRVMACPPTKFSADAFPADATSRPTSEETAGAPFLHALSNGRDEGDHCPVENSLSIAPQSCGTSQRKRIILADDFIELAEVMGCALTDAGYTVTIVHDGNRAVERLQAEPPDLAVLDIDMPGTSGLEVCRFVKSREELRDLPVILYTGRYGLDDRVRAQELGANAFLQKPFALAELLSQVRAVLIE